MMTNIELRQKFPSICRKPLALYCPYCGQIHYQTRLRLLVATLFFIATWIGLFAPEAQANSEVGAEASNQPIHISRKRGQQVKHLVDLPPVIINPTPALVLQTSPSPTPLPIPKTGIIWSPVSTGVYLYAEPGLEILLEIPNGVFVHLFDEFAPYGNLAWTRIESEEKEGWVEATKVSRLRFEGEMFYLVNDVDGTYLYATPQGQIVAWLPFGTPLRYQDTKEGWVTVSTLNGEEGWVLLDKLLPPNENQP